VGEISKLGCSTKDLWADTLYFLHTGFHISVVKDYEILAGN
jgi:hypothetical protein